MLPCSPLVSGGDLAKTLDMSGRAAAIVLINVRNLNTLLNIFCIT